MTKRGIKERISKAIALYKNFRGENPEFVDDLTVDLPDTAFVVGKLDAVIYTTTRDGEKLQFIHKFTARAKPLLCSSYDGKQLLLIGGRYTFTDRGIVDKTRLK